MDTKVTKKSKQTKRGSSKKKTISSAKKNKRRYIAPPPSKKRTGERVSAAHINFKQGKGTPNAGGMSGGYFWHIFHNDIRAGKIFINYDKETNKAEIQIFINRKSQGKGIGRIAYKNACEESKYNKIYATMRKDNIASIKAALAAGFKEIPSSGGQMTMLWQKK
jgi:Acetyltransferase (GNAT) domain